MLGLTHNIARNHRVMNPSVFGRKEAHMSHGRKTRKGAEMCRDKDRRTYNLRSDICNIHTVTEGLSEVGLNLK